MPSRSREEVNAIVVKHLGLVKHIAAQYLGCGVPLDDLIGEGNLGLIWAAEDYDPERGTTFATFASPRIKQFVLNAIEQRGTVRLPKNRQWDRINALRAYDRLTQRFGREPSVDEVAADSGLPLNRTEVALRALNPSRLSLRETPSGVLDEWTPHADHTPPADEELHEQQKAEIVRQLLEGLDEKDLNIVRLRFGIGNGEARHTLEDVGKSMGYTRERIRQREAKILSGLRQKLERAGISEFDIFNGS